MWSSTKRNLNIQASRREESKYRKFHEQKSARHKFHEQIQFHLEENHCTSFAKKKSTCNKFQEQNQHATISMKKKLVSRGGKSKHKFHEAKNRYTTSFINKNQFHKEKNTCTSFTERKTRWNKFHEQKSEYNDSCEQKTISQQTPWIKSISRWGKLISTFQEEKNQNATSFMNINHQATIAVNKISFTRRKIIIQVSRREK